MLRNLFQHGRHRLVAHPPGLLAVSGREAADRLHDPKLAVQERPVFRTGVQ